MNEKNKLKHSPTPFETDGKFIRTVAKVNEVMSLSPSGKVSKPFMEKDTVARMVGLETEANAAFIVQACNAHEALVRVVKELAEIPTFSETPGVAAHDEEFDTLVFEAREALKLAGE